MITKTRRQLTGMILGLYALRVLQIARILKDIGVIRVIVLLLVCLHVLVLVPHLFIHQPIAGSIIFAIMIFTLNFKRDDRTFLVTNFGTVSRYAVMAEYHAISIPLYTFFIYSGNFASLTLLFVSMCAIPFFTVWRRGAKGSVKRIPFLPRTSFEVRSGMRNTYLLVIAVIMIGVLPAWYAAAPLSALVILTVIFAYYHLRCESVLMVQAFERSPRKFLLTKISHQIAFAQICYLPVNVAFLYYHTELWYLLVAVNLASVFVQSLAICFKYAFYSEGEDLWMNKYLLWISIIFLVTGFLIPATIILFIIYYRKALRQLNRYLYAHH